MLVRIVADLAAWLTRVLVVAGAVACIVDGSIAAYVLRSRKRPHD